MDVGRYSKESIHVKEIWKQNLIVKKEHNKLSKKVSSIRFEKYKMSKRKLKEKLVTELGPIKSLIS